MENTLSDMRKDYRRGYLRRDDLSENPYHLFKEWFAHAMDSGIPEPNAMVLSTINSLQQPSSRIVLLKDFDEEGFVFFTNYESNKGIEISGNPQVALLFAWHSIERQVRIEGTAFKTSPDVSDRYFFSRPAGSRLGAWVSAQSKVIGSREELETRQKQYHARFGEEVPRPEWWGGYIVEPVMFEFWQGRSDRLHDRFRYRRSDGGSWDINRLAP